MSVEAESCGNAIGTVVDSVICSPSSSLLDTSMLAMIRIEERTSPHAVADQYPESRARRCRSWTLCGVLVTPRKWWSVWEGQRR